MWGFAAGGGLDVAFSGNATVTNCTLIGNQAIGSSGANGGTGFGGGISLGFSYFFNTAAFPVLDLSTLSAFQQQASRATSLKAAAAEQREPAGDGHGGGLAMNPGSSATVADSAIDFNLALGRLRRHVRAGNRAAASITTAPSKDFLTLLAFNFASTSNDNIYH